MAIINTKSDMASLDKWLGSVRGKRPLAVILGGSGHALIYSRSLGRRGIPTLTLDKSRDTGLYTRYGMTSLLPSVDENPAAWIAFLKHVAERLGERPVLFPTADEYLLFLARHREQVADRFHLIIPDSDTIEQIINKRIQYSIAENAGIPVPRTFYPESLGDVRVHAAELSYPVILKPYMYRGGKIIREKWLPAHSPAELIEQFRRVSASGHAFMVQEFIPGPRQAIFAYHGFWDRDGREIAWWTKQHLRGTHTEGSYHLTVEAPEVAALGRRFLTALKYKGFSHVEFKIDSRDGSYRLMEINARTGQSTQHGIAAGVDLPWLGYRHLTDAMGAETAPIAFKTGVTYVHEQTDLMTYLNMRKTGEIRFVPWLLSVLKADAKAIWASDDPVPFFMTAWKKARSLLRKTAARVTAMPWRRVPAVH
jgi:predicted ATP-grasp superfamily ATP-dependent carboligase